MANLTELQLLSWGGYQRIIEHHETHLQDRGIRVHVTEVENADAIRRYFLRQHQYYDVVIVDLEYRRLFDDFVLPLPNNIIDMDAYLEPFRQPSWYQVRSSWAYVPLRFGTNGFLHRTNGSPDRQRPARSLREILEEGNGGAPLRIAVWDWWLPNLLLLARILGLGRYSTPEHMTAQDFTDLKSLLFQRFIPCVQRTALSAQQRTFSGLAQIIAREVTSGDSSNHIDWILGPSEMVVAPISHIRRHGAALQQLDWDIPEEGGLIWLEMAAVSKHLEDPQNTAKRQAAEDFIRFLQTREIQQTLMCCGDIHAPHTVTESGHWAYVLNNTAGLEGIPPELRRSFRNPPFEQNAQVFGRWVQDRMDSRQLIVRVLPKDIVSWEDLWRKVIRACRHG